MNSSYIRKGEHKSCATEFKKGYVPWNKGIKGYHIHSEEYKVKLGNRQRGKPLPEGCRRKGSEHYAWKGGVSRAYKDGHNSIEHRGWRRTVFVRDVFTCQDCGARQTYVEAHHIKPWSKFPELRFVPSNGITLCKTCHNKIHAKGV